MNVGAYLPADGPIELSPGRSRHSLEVSNTGDRAIQVGSHFHFFEANKALCFDRAATLGMRLDIPSGTALRWEPGDTRTVSVVAFGGSRRCVGFNGLVNGSAVAHAASALANARSRGFVPAPDTAETP
jgi:urease beta subunit